MTTIYAVTSGSYSSYSVDAVFSTRAAAERMLSVMTDNDKSIEEWQLDENVLNETEPFSVSSSEDSIEVRHLSWSPGYDEEPVAAYQSNYSGRNRKWLTAVVMARDVEHAKKIAADKFREFIALNGWPKETP